MGIGVIYYARVRVCACARVRVCAYKDPRSPHGVQKYALGVFGSQNAQVHAPTH